VVVQRVALFAVRCYKPEKKIPPDNISYAVEEIVLFGN